MSEQMETRNLPELQEFHATLIFNRKDGEVEKKVADFAGFCESGGVKLHVPSFGFDVLPSGKYVSEITAAVKRSARVLIFISRSYLESPQFGVDIGIVEEETVERGKEILTPVLCGVSPDSLPDRLTRGRSLPVSGATGDFHQIPDGWDALIKRIARQPQQLSTVSVGIGNGLGVSHFFGYLQFILPGLSERIKEEFIKSGSNWDCSRSAVIYPKNIAITPIVPSAGQGMVWLDSLTEYDARIVPVKSLADGKPVKVMFEKDTPGHAGRPYPCTMWKATVEGKEYVFFAEIPNTLRTPFMLKSSGLAFPTDESLQQELWDFSRQLQGILTSFQDEFTSSRVNSIKFLEFDARTSGEEKLADIIAKAIEDDLSRDASVDI